MTDSTIADEFKANEERKMSEDNSKIPESSKNNNGDIFIFDKKSGEDFVRSLEDNNVHPVLVFGTRAAGKSTMLASLLSYVTGAESATVNASLGDNLFPSSTRDSQNRYVLAQKFFNMTLPSFLNGALPAGTNDPIPFVIPLDIKADFSDKAPIQCKFAFFEGQGEWYEIDKGTGYTYNEFKIEISSILKRFSNPISVIFVAPCDHPEGREELDKSHRGLANCINQYINLRTDKTKDNVLLLLTKWDSKHPPGRSDDFFDPSLGTVLDELKKGRFVWPAFSSLQGVEGKALLPYSSGLIVDGAVNSPGSHKATLDRYNRILFNWLFGNAAQKSSKGITRRPILYPDAAPPNKPIGGAVDRLIKIFVN